MTENEKYQIIKKLVDSGGNKQTAASKIGSTLRHVNRLIAGYKNSGKVFFVHGNHTHKPAITIPAHTKKLGIDIRTSSIPQSKGRVERMNGTLQSRLPVKLRLNNISSIDEANKFLNSNIKKFIGILDESALIRFMGFYQHLFFRKSFQFHRMLYALLIHNSSFFECFY